METGLGLLFFEEWPVPGLYFSGGGVAVCALKLFGSWGGAVWDSNVFFFKIGCLPANT